MVARVLGRTAAPSTDARLLHRVVLYGAVSVWGLLTGFWVRRTSATGRLGRLAGGQRCWCHLRLACPPLRTVGSVRDLHAVQPGWHSQVAQHQLTRLDFFHETRAPSHEVGPFPFTTRADVMSRLKLAPWQARPSAHQGRPPPPCETQLQPDLSVTRPWATRWPGCPCRG